MSGLYLIFCIVLIVAVIGAASIIFFRVNRIVVEGNSHYTTEEIVAASGVSQGDNLMLTGQSTVAVRLKNALPYISSVSIRKSLPDTLVISVSESGAQAVIYDGQGSWWLMDVSGKLLEEVSAGAASGGDAAGETDGAESGASSGAEPEQDGSGEMDGTGSSSGVQPEITYQAPVTAAPEGYPVILGLPLEAPGAGRTIAVSDTAERTRGLMLKSLLGLLPALQNHGLLKDVTTIDLSGDSELLVLYQNRLTIKLLQEMDYDYQARLIQKVLDDYVSESWTAEDAGTLDMTFSDGNPRLSKNTPSNTGKSP